MGFLALFILNICDGLFMFIQTWKNTSQFGLIFNFVCVCVCKVCFKKWVKGVWRYAKNVGLSPHIWYIFVAQCFNIHLSFFFRMFPPLTPVHFLIHSFDSEFVCLFFLAYYFMWPQFVGTSGLLLSECGYLLKSGSHWEIIFEMVFLKANSTRCD